MTGRVLVTGATGFLGTALVKRLLDSDYHVTGLARRSDALTDERCSDFIAVDLSDLNASRAQLQPWRWDTVIHLAGPAPARSAGSDAWSMIASHANAALHLCACLPPHWSGRVIHASSMVVYGMPQHLPVDESHPRQPLDAYGIAKCLAEDIVVSASAEKELDVWILRLPGLFSESRKNGALYSFAVNAARGDALKLAVTHPMPWEALHLEDAVEAIIRASHSQVRHAGVVNVGYGRAMSLRTAAENIVRRLNSNSSIEGVNGVVHPEFCLDIRKARTLLDWPSANFEDRLGRFCDTLSGALTI